MDIRSLLGLLTQHGQTKFSFPTRRFLPTPLLSFCQWSCPPPTCSDTNPKHALRSLFLNTPCPVQQQVSSMSPPKSLKSNQLLSVHCCPLFHLDLNILTGLPASIFAPCMYPIPSPPPLGGFPLQRDQKPSSIPSTKPYRIWTLPSSPASPEFSILQSPRPSPWAHGAHRCPKASAPPAPPPGTLYPKAASLEMPPRTRDPKCNLQPSPSPPPPQSPVPSLRSSVPPSPNGSLSALILLPCGSTCLLPFCHLPTREHLDNLQGSGHNGNAGLLVQKLIRILSKTANQACGPVRLLRPPTWKPARLRPPHLEGEHPEATALALLVHRWTNGGTGKGTPWKEWKKDTIGRPLAQCGSRSGIQPCDMIPKCSVSPPGSPSPDPPSFPAVAHDAHLHSWTCRHASRPGLQVPGAADD